MNFQDAKDLLRKGFLAKAFALESEDGESLTLSHASSINPILITKDLIADYASVGDVLGGYVPRDGRPDVIGTGYREQRVLWGEFSVGSLSEIKYVFGDTTGPHIYLETSPASTAFWSSCLFDEALVDYYISRFNRYKKL